MSLAEWGLLVAVVSLLVGIGALWYARRAARVSEEELRVSEEELEITRELATLRPKLEVSLRDVVYHYRPESPGSPYEQAAIVFDIANNGRSAAHNVRCQVRLDERHLVLDDMHGANYDFSAAHLGPSESQPHQVNVAVLAHGPTEAHYRCVCDEVGKSESTVKFEVPEREQG